MSQEKQGRIFISYSRKNFEFALNLAKELRSSGFATWLDQLDIPAGSRWDDEVEEALEKCEIFVVILTPASSESDNVKDEISYAIDNDKQILPILLENAERPLRLRRFQYVDFTEMSHDEGVEAAKKLLEKLVTVPMPPGNQSADFEDVPKNDDGPKNPPGNYAPQRLHSDLDLDINAIKVIKTISRTKNSVIEKCLLNDAYHVLKRSNKEICDYGSLQKLVGKKIIGRSKRVSTKVATPLAVWQTDDYIWELHSWYDGITLHEMMSKSKYFVTESLLGDMHNSLFKAVGKLHELGILHRDISPLNILISGSDDSIQLTLIDCSFCCSEFDDQIPVEDRSYSAPEQRDGKARRQSDWYSIASTIYYLGNGEPPNLDEEEEFKNGLWNLNFGNYAPSSTYTPDPEQEPMWGGHHPDDSFLIIESLLYLNIEKRPSNLHEVILRGVSSAIFARTLISLLDIGESRFIAITNREFSVLDQSEIAEFVKTIKIGDPSLGEYMYGEVLKNN